MLFLNKKKQVYCTLLFHICVIYNSNIVNRVLSSQYLDKMDLASNLLWCRWPHDWHYGSLTDRYMMFYIPQLVYRNTWLPRTPKACVSDDCKRILEKEKKSIFRARLSSWRVNRPYTDNTICCRFKFFFFICLYFTLAYRSDSPFSKIVAGCYDFVDGRIINPVIGITSDS